MAETPETRRWVWKGARWWKFDFHAHTPASRDYGKGPDETALRAITPCDWLLAYMRAGIDCVAITDHNTGAWIDKLRGALEELRTASHPDFREIHLFPGVEISVNGGVHVLAILDSERSSSDIDALLGAVEYDGTKGDCDGVTKKSLVEVVEKIATAGGVAIPAHADVERGLFRLEGETLRQALQSPFIHAMELRAPDYELPRLCREENCPWTVVIGSDAHQLTRGQGARSPGSGYTWVKMSAPNLEGLRLALLDGALSVLRSDQVQTDPNEHAKSLIESITVTQARYIGREREFRVTLNPWLNAIIGGRGTGKSTLVEFARLALRRWQELPASLVNGEANGFKKYRTPYGDRRDTGLLTENTLIEVIYRKDGTRYRLQWNYRDDATPIACESMADQWEPEEGDIVQRFPVRIFSQKQVLELAKDPAALLTVVDDAPDVGRPGWAAQWREVEARFLALRGQLRQLESQLKEESRLRGEVLDIERKLRVFEAAGHADVLTEYHRRIREQRAIEDWQLTWDGSGDRLRTLADELVPAPIASEVFGADSDDTREIIDLSRRVCERFGRVAARLCELAQELDAAQADWEQSRDAAAWWKAARDAVRRYEELAERLRHEGAGDPSEYGQLVQRRHALQVRLRDLDAVRKQIDELRAHAESALAETQGLRREITERRKAFLAKALDGNRYVRIQVVPYGARDAAEQALRDCLGIPGRFDDDFGALVDEVFTVEGDDSLDRGQAIEEQLRAVKEKLRRFARGEHSDDLRDQRLARRLRELPPETLDRLDAWYPEDTLAVEYSPRGDGHDFRPILEGSPGQKSAALLAFFLSYGEEPIIMDQPEDDLDNSLIFDLVVRQLREIKRKRQVVVVTHNANIVVNGDAELVVALEAHSGQTRMACADGLQVQEVRHKACEILEGGRDALVQRYRRMALEKAHV